MLKISTLSINRYLPCWPMLVHYWNFHFKQSAIKGAFFIFLSLNSNFGICCTLEEKLWHISVMHLFNAYYTSKIYAYDAIMLLINPFLSE